MNHLALLLRPKSLDSLVGQAHLFAPNAPLRRIIESGNLPSAIFFGPPGSGKTSAARAIATQLELPYKLMNATSLKIDELRAFAKEFAHRLRRPLVFIDEIHRLSKTQEEVLLPYMEEGSMIVLGASTQNPYHSLTHAFRSRAMLFEFYPLSRDDLAKLLQNASDCATFTLEEDARNYLIDSSSGDARAMLQLLDCALCVQEHISLEILKSLRPNALQGGSDEPSRHYDIASAFIKSLRGSDENAAIYYLAMWLNEGEDVSFIARRMAIFASEDVGNANPNALMLASATLSAVQQIGMPEARIILAQCAIYLACCPKSNAAYLAIDSALQSLKEGTEAIPENIRHHCRNYLYPHDYGGFVQQRYMTKPMQYVQMKGIGFEKTLLEWISKIRKGS